MTWRAGDRVEVAHQEWLPPEPPTLWDMTAGREGESPSKEAVWPRVRPRWEPGTVSYVTADVIGVVFDQRTRDGHVRGMALPTGEGRLIRAVESGTPS